MYGAIIGDVAGSVLEFEGIKSRNFPIFDRDGFFTDDSVMTAAVFEAILDSQPNDGKTWFDPEVSENLRKNTIKRIREYGKLYPNAGYGGNFAFWLRGINDEPYNSFGNGSAMRVSSAAYVSDSLDECLHVSDIVTGVTHNHPEGIKGARAVVSAIFKALHGDSKDDIYKYIRKEYYPQMTFTLAEIMPSYRFDESCQRTVPQAITSFYEADSYEDAIRNAISLGGDADTLGCITGSIAEAYFGVPDEMVETLRTRYLDSRMKQICDIFEDFTY